MRPAGQAQVLPRVEELVTAAAAVGGVFVGRVGCQLADSLCCWRRRTRAGILLAGLALAERRQAAEELARAGVFGGVFGHGKRVTGVGDVVGGSMQETHAAHR